MKVKLDDTHFLNGDKWCYWISTIVTPDPKKSKKKEPYEVVTSGWFPDLEKLMDSKIKRFMGISSAKTFTQLLKEFREFRKEMRTWCRSIEAELAELRGAK